MELENALREETQNEELTRLGELEMTGLVWKAMRKLRFEKVVKKATRAIIEKRPQATGNMTDYEKLLYEDMVKRFEEYFDALK